jgi:hypothetical protein
MLVVLSGEFSTFNIVLMLIGLVAVSVLGGAALAHMTQEKPEKKKQ